MPCATPFSTCALRRHGHPEHPRYGGGGEHVRFDFHDLPRQESARRAARQHPEEFGNDTIRVSAEGGWIRSIENLPNVEKVRDLGQVQEIRMARGCDPQEVLRALLGRTKVTSFSITRPSLHDIFVRIAGPEVAEAHHA